MIHSSLNEEWVAHAENGGMNSTLHISNQITRNLLDIASVGRSPGTLLAKPLLAIPGAEWNMKVGRGIVK